MCFDLDSRPPIPPMAGGAYASRHLELVSGDGNHFGGFEARAGDLPSRAAVLIMPDVRGLHTYYEELALRFAEAGIDALAIDYFGRTAGIGDRGEGFDYRAYVDKVTWPEVAADMSAGARYLAGTGEPAEGGRAIFSVGFCFGGRLAFLCATLHGPSFAGVIGFYGHPVGVGRGGSPAPADMAAEFDCPVLGIFGGADKGIPASSANAFETALQRAGVANEIVVYPDAPHSFFDRKYEEYRDASADAWQRVLGFIRTTASAARPGA
jgi:carboxymethylenebutenolidase